MNESEGLWEQREDNQMAKRSVQTARGNQWAKYATGTVMAPMMFVLPFPTMVDVDEQYNQQMISGGNYVRNFLGGFVLIAVFSAIFITKNWRNLPPADLLTRRDSCCQVCLCCSSWRHTV